MTYNAYKPNLISVGLIFKYSFAANIFLALPYRPEYAAALCLSPAHAALAYKAACYTEAAVVINPYVPWILKYQNAEQRSGLLLRFR